MKTELNADLAYCEALIRANSSSFYRAFRNLSKEKAQAVFAIYAFCRIADDAIDEANDPLIVQRMQKDLKALEKGPVPDQPMWRALAWAFENFNLQIKPFEEMLRGQLMDVDFKQPQRLEDLLDYCYLVAGTVGQMLNPLLSSRQSTQLERASIELGEAMQLTNILRDLGSDYKMNRIYLPAEMMASAQVSANDLQGPEASANLIGLWEKLAREAEKRYDHIESKLSLYDPEARLPVLLSIRYYRGILDQGRKSNYQMLRKRIYVSDFKKFKIFLNTKRELRTANFSKNQGGDN